MAYNRLPQREDEEKGDDDTRSVSDGGGAAGAAGGVRLGNGGGVGEVGGCNSVFCSSPASAAGSTNTTAALSPMTFLSLADSTFTPLSMTTTSTTTNSTSSDLLYIGSLDVDEDGDEELEDHLYNSNNSNNNTIDDYEHEDHGADSPSHSRTEAHLQRRTAPAAKWPRRRKSPLKASSALGMGGPATATAPANMAAQSLQPPTRATAAEGYGLLLSNSPAPEKKKKKYFNRGRDISTITPSPSVSPAIDTDPHASSQLADAYDDDEEEGIVGAGGSTSHGGHEESEESSQTQLQDSLGLARHHHIADARQGTRGRLPAANRSSQPPSPSNSTSSPGIIRPKPVRKSLPPAVASPTSSSSSPPPPQPLSATQSPDEPRRHSPTVIRTASVASVLRHPVPDLNTRSGAYTSNIAALEATAERLSMTSSIEDAIRNAHDELKRSDSRRSSILAASARSVSGENTIEGLDKLLPSAIRQSSILELNNAARSGGYSPAGYVMSPNHSLSSRLRSSSKSSVGPLSRHSSTRSRPGEPVEGDAFPFISRTGPGKGSVHSVHSVHSTRSAQLSLAEIAEMEPPTTLTHEAMEAADHATRNGPDTEDEDTIRASAHQYVEPGATDIEVDMDLTPSADAEARQPMLDHALDSYWNDESSPQLHLRNPENPVPYRDEYEPPVEQQKRPATSGSYETSEQVNAFDDFDGVHCDPDTVAEQFPFHPEEAQYPPPVQRESRPISQLPPRPKSYFDNETGQQMLYYPARVPAMLNLPPKLGRGPRTNVRNARRSQVLSVMPQASRESRVWLPDPMEGQMGSPLMDEGLSTSSKGPASASVEQFPQMPEPAVQDQALPSPDMQDQQPPELQHLRRPAKLSEADKRKSRMSAMTDLPPQLRASAFFDLPSETPKIEIQDGSAMATLDSILDAAASAPVSAFTDHAFAGKLGSEVYGPAKKNKKKDRQSQMLGSNSSDKGHKSRLSNATALGVPEVEKRKSVWSLLPGRRVSDAATVEGGRSTVLLVDDEHQRLSGERSPLSEGGAALAPDEDEAESSSEEEEEEVYQGAPTTLLAELQIRKQQQKMRTRPLHKAFPNGLHSTLLEMDTVAQVEAKQRRGKKVNLAWEDPDMNSHAEDDDEDVPLGMLVAQKQAGNADISAVAAELNRPIGLMERRDMEENEPLSRRRDRLQGKEVPVSMYLNPTAGPTRQSVLNLAPTMSALNLGQRGMTPSPRLVEADDDEVEGETLGERMRRLRAKDEAENPLPRTRPVSTTFSAELLSQFGGDDDDAKSKAGVKGKGKANTAPAPEEEETLGQRRRRLQAEREAREREMAAGGGAAVNLGALNALNGNAPEGRLSRRLSLADVLSANPLDSARGPMDPREAERLRREEEAARTQKIKDEQMRMYRSQMPTSLRDPGAGLNKAGGYLGGRFNDGNAGGGPGGMGLRASASMGTLNGQMRGAPQVYYPQAQGQQFAYGGMQQPQYPQQQQSMMNMGMGGYTNPYGTMTMTGAYGNGYAAGMPMQMNGMGMGMQNTQGQLDMVERWRRSVMPQ